MDIELLSKMVGELVLDHHEVGLPGLGTFVSEFVPASFSDRGYTINPPYRRVTFVPGTSGDDSLIKLYASSNSIDVDQAKAIIRRFLEDTKKVLMDRKTIVFPGLGRLRATRQNNFFFITDESLDIYPEGFGLEPVSLKNHEAATAEAHHVVSSLADILIETSPQSQEPVEIIEPETFEPAEESVAISSNAGLVEPAEPAEPPIGEVSAGQEYMEPITLVRKPEYIQPVTAVKKTEYYAPAIKTHKKRSKWPWIVMLCILGLAVLSLGVFMVLAQVAPDFIDTVLYTPEELRIINY